MFALLLLLVAASHPPALPVFHSADEIFDAVRASRHPTVVHFWATWCRTCLDELPEVRRLAKGLEGSGADLLFVSLDDPRKSEKVAKFMKDKGLLSTRQARGALLEAEDPGPVTARFDAKWTAQLPATFFLLESGTTVASHLGPTPVDAVLAEVRAHAGNTEAALPEPHVAKPH